MSFETWIVFVAVAILPSLSPGPAILLAISNALKFGPRSVLFSAIGNAIGLTILGLAVAFGLSAVMEASAVAFTVVKIAGAIYLIYLGLKLWLSGGALSVQADDQRPMKSRRALFTEALALAVTNPKGLVLLAVILPPFIDHAQPVLPQAVILSITFAMMCFINHLFLAVMGGRARTLLTSPRRLKTVQRLLGSLFLAFGASLALMSR